MPTIALMNGHTFAGGLFTAMCHDYRIQNPTRGFSCLNEIDIGMVIPTAILSLFREKAESPRVFRNAALEGKRFTGPEALENGLVDGLGGLDEALKLAEERKLLAKVESGPWGKMREDMYRETLAYLRDYRGTQEWRARIDEEKVHEAKQRSKRVSEWESKL
jgi:enoyl-CoA hydratase/carnithine racemase